MLVLNNLGSYRPQSGRPLILAIGNFDGVHLAHQKLLGRVVESARAQNGIPAAFTFREHPQHVLHPSSKPPLLTGVGHKLSLLKEAGIELCFMLSFTSDFARLEPAEFVRDVLVGQLGVREVYLGHNARFGRDRKGDSAVMKKLAGEAGFFYGELPPVQAGGENVSSSRIRVLVREGKLDEAAACLGRPFDVFGTVVEGDKRGSKIGFPTANLEVASEILPPLGVYPVRLREMNLRRRPADGGELFEPETGPWLEGVLNYGYRPTFEGGQKAVPEVFVLDFKGNLYGKTLAVSFYPRLRPEMRFSGPEELKARIAGDVEEARRFFAARPAIR